MDLFGPVQKVFSIDEVLELILEFAASMEPWYNSSNLRLVSKRWRSLSFRGLCQSSELPTICIRDSKKLIWSDGLDEVSLQFFKKNFPKICPRRMHLTKPVLPIALRIRRYPTRAEISLIQKSASHIAAVTVEHQSKKRGNLFGVHIAGGQMDFLAQLPNLRCISVIWDIAIVRDPGFTEIVDILRRCSKRLTHVEYTYAYDMDSKDLPDPPSNLTHISYVGSAPGLQKLLSGTVENLSGLQFEFQEEKLEDEAFDCATLNEVLQNQSKTLRELKISGPDGPSLTGAVEVYEMKSLKILNAHVPVQFKVSESSSVSSDRSSNLTHLEYTIKNWPKNASAALEALRLSSSSLKYLILNWPAECEIYKNSAANKLCEEAFLEGLEQGIPLCSELKELKLFKFPFRVGIALMPMVYDFMANITRLNLSYRKSNEPTKTANDHDKDFFRILTGWDPEDVPTDELMWPKFLKRSRRPSVASLKHLERLELRASKTLKCVLGRFIFRTGFMRMPKLWSIDVIGGIMVDPDMIKEWEECGHDIDTEESVYHSSTGSSDNNQPNISDGDQSSSSSDDLSSSSSG